MTIITVSEPFSIELSGDVHPPHWMFELELCALLFHRGETAPSAFTGTRCPTTITGVTAEKRQGKYSTIGVDVMRIDLAYTRLIIAAHPEEVTPATCRRDGKVAINPTLRHLTYSARGALGFGQSASFIDEDAVLGARLLTLERTEEGWRLDDDQLPASYSELANFAKAYDVELNPYGA